MRKKKVDLVVWGDSMQQMHLFDPTFKQRLEEIVNEQIEDYFITKSFVVNEQDNLHLHYCKVLTKKNVYDVTISEDYNYQSEINYKSDRKEFNKYGIRDYFKRHGAIFKKNYIS
ncbi:hypothetical protein [Bacillus sp. JJ722]|uniref:hypothetical protein n=1 Tax=Bacillus sp. JJ722 TaxID=3122973 RepID=UPI002FFE4952